MMRSDEKGFSVLEFAMVVLLLAILGAIAIPSLVDIRSDSKNGQTQAAVGKLRLAIARFYSDTSKFPTLVEMQSQVFEVPKNPWTLASLKEDSFRSVSFCGDVKSTVSMDSETLSRGWCYNETNGQIWANTNRNGAANGKTENFY